MRWGRHLICFALAAAGAAGAALFAADAARAASGAFAVDDPDIGTPWSCKVESWTSFADNRTFLGVSAPACVLDIVRPVEVTTQFQRSRVDDLWGTSLQIKGKTTIVPSQTGHFGIGLVGATSYDLLTGENTALSAYIPVSYQITDQFRLLFNGGWLWDRVAQQNFVTYGAGFEWNFVKPLTLIAEVFGQAGPATDPRTVTDPRFQVGLRITPIEAADVDVIYGRNITGENANWITIGLNVRFQPPGK
jgi:hypothetical protein